jgi:hypothetical protein
MLHACERDIARTWLIDSCKIGELEDIIRQAQSILVFIKDLNESQHVVDGTKPLLVLPVMMLAQGVNVLLIIEDVHDELICPLIKLNDEEIIRAASINVIL